MSLITVVLKINNFTLYCLDIKVIKLVKKSQMSLVSGCSEVRMRCAGHSPAGLVSSGEPLDGDGSVAFAQILLACQPTADGFLDADAGSTQLVCPQLLQVSDLASPEEDLGLTKLVFILILKEDKSRGQE